MPLGHKFFPPPHDSSLLRKYSETVGLWGFFVHSRSRPFKGSVDVRLSNLRTYVHRPFERTAIDPLDVRRDFSGLFLIHYTLFLHELKPQTALQMAYRINRHMPQKHTVFVDTAHAGHAETGRNGLKRIKNGDKRGLFEFIFLILQTKRGHRWPTAGPAYRENR